MSRIPQPFIQELVARTDLVDLIGTRVTLKRAGSSHKGLCPFHDEKTPSFTVSPERGTFKCFGCGAWGNAIDFLMRYENREFLEAVEILAEMHHMDIPVERGAQPAEDHADLYDVLREADQFYRERLRENPDAIRYLKQRGLEGATAARFGIGYAPDAWNALLERLGNGPAGVERLIRAGLAVKSEQGRVYDRFRDRIMFPIRDGRGRVIGFGGRLMGAGEPKYLNSPDTPLFDKSRTLYGLYEARQQKGRPERIVVVEGYVDVIALDQHGAGPAMATMGTAATPENMRQLTRFSDRVVFCFDGDRAGREAAWRAVQSVLPFGGGKVAIEFVLLPDGEDPDSFVRSRGAAAFEALLAQATPLSSFLIAQAAADLDLGNADGRARLAGRVTPLLEKLPNGLYRELIVGELAEKTGIRPERFESRPGAADGAAARSHAAPSSYATSSGQTGAASHASAAGQASAGGHATASGTLSARRRADDAGRSVMQKAVCLLLHFPRAGAAAGDIPGLDALEVPGAELLRRLLEITANEPHITTGQLIETFRQEPDGRWIERLARDEPLDDEAAAPQVLRDSLERIVARERRRAEVEALRRRADPAPRA